MFIAFMVEKILPIFSLTITFSENRLLKN